MIGALKGNVAYLGADYCIVDTAGGVGYRVFMPASHLAQLVLDSKVSLRIHTTVREDAILLYGFLSQEYYELFELLLTVSGVGPKMALGILSTMKPEDFYLAVQSKDIKALTKLPGVGKKTAERMLLELKDKVGSITSEGDSFEEVVAAGGSNAVAEAIEALNSLGYSNSEIMPVLQQIPNAADLSGEALLRQALKLFAKQCCRMEGSNGF